MKRAPKDGPSPWAGKYSRLIDVARHELRVELVDYLAGIADWASDDDYDPPELSVLHAYIEGMIGRVTPSEWKLLEVVLLWASRGGGRFTAKEQRRLSRFAIAGRRERERFNRRRSGQ